jgi:hypothetical protein
MQFYSERTLSIHHIYFHESATSSRNPPVQMYYFGMILLSSTSEKWIDEEDEYIQPSAKEEPQMHLVVTDNSITAGIFTAIVTSTYSSQSIWMTANKVQHSRVKRPRSCHKPHVKRLRSCPKPHVKRLRSYLQNPGTLHGHHLAIYAHLNGEERK